MAKDGGDQIGTLGEVTVDRPYADTSLLRNVPHRRIDSRRGEDFPRRLHDGADVAAGIGADATTARFSLCCLIFASRHNHHPC